MELESAGDGELQGEQGRRWGWGGSAHSAARAVAVGLCDV